MRIGLLRSAKPPRKKQQHYRNSGRIHGRGSVRPDKRPWGADRAQSTNLTAHEVSRWTDCSPVLEWNRFCFRRAPDQRLETWAGRMVFNHFHDPVRLDRTRIARLCSLQPGRTIQPASEADGEFGLSASGCKNPIQLDSGRKGATG